MNHSVALRLYEWLSWYALRRFERRTRHCAKVNAQTLRRILSAHRDTAYANETGLSARARRDIDVDAYRRHLPLTTYAELEPYVDRIAAGEDRVLTHDPVIVLAGTAGTTDRPKRIPQTRRAQRQHVMHAVMANQAMLHRALPEARRTRGVNLMSLKAPVWSSAGKVAVMSAPNSAMARIRKQIPLFWTSPIAVYDVADQATADYLHALFALRARHLSFIESPFAPHVVSWLGVMERQAAQLVADIRAGRLSGDIALTDAERTQLEAQLAPDPGRAEELGQAFAEDTEGIVPRLWPRLAYIRTVTTGSFAPYLERLRFLSGPKILIHSSCHSASEGITGVNLRADGRSDYVLTVGTAFYEFIPAEQMGQTQPDTLLPEQLSVGHDYEVVLTTWGGLYRYRTGDVIRVRGWYHATPEFEYRYRRGTILNLVGEKMTEHQTAQALELTMQSVFGDTRRLLEYTVAPAVSGSTGRYVIYAALSGDKLPDPVTANRLEQCLDTSLSKVNSMYRYLGRNRNRLHPARLHIVCPAVFESLAKQRLDQLDAANRYQTKLPKIISDPALLATLQAGARSAERRLAQRR